ncbi:hypothetical protein ACFPLB_12990 [Aquamicrobium segne]|uniref:Lipoprotein n=1 Tax=Aquamicrobium segne TaxID=469547 RepID=A0ABW0GZE6_9HYPH
MTADIEKAPIKTIRFSFVLATLAALAVVSGCAASSSVQTQSASRYSSPGNLVGPQDTGHYPNLNIRPEKAAAQFTDDEARAKLAALEAQRNAARNPARAAYDKNEAAALRRLGSSHGAQTLRQIEGGCDVALDPTCK